MAGGIIRKWHPGSDAKGPPDEVVELGTAKARPEDYKEGVRHAADDKRA